MKKYKNVKLSLPKWRIDEIKKMAKLSGLSVSDVVNVILAKSLVESEREDKLHKPKP